MDYVETLKYSYQSSNLVFINLKMEMFCKYRPKMIVNLSTTKLWAFEAPKVLHFDESGA